MSKLVSWMYRAARTTNDVDAVVHPQRLPRRVINKVKGRALARLEFWRFLWQK